MAMDNTRSNYRTGARLLKWLLLCQPLLIGLAYGANIFFLNAVFDVWGVHGAQLFTLQDMTVPGFLINYLLVTVLVLPCSLAMLFSWRPRRKAFLIGLRLGVWGVLIACWTSSFFVGEHYRLICMLGAASAGILLFMDMWKWRKVKVRAKLVAGLIGVIVLLGVAMWTRKAYAGLVTLTAEVGLVRGMAVEDPKTPCAGRVLWLGERIIAIRCWNESQGVRMMTPEGGLHFVSVAKAKGGYRSSGVAEVAGSEEATRTATTKSP